MSFLLKSGNGTWYFRIAVPKALRRHYGKLEIKRSLKTKSKSEALKYARTYAAKFHSQFRALAIMANYPYLNFTGFKIAKITKADGTTLEGVEVDPDNPKDAEAIQQLLGSAAIINQQPESSPLLSQVFAKYRHGKIRSGNWKKPKTLSDRDNLFNACQRIIGDPEIKTVTHVVANDFKEKLLQLPPNMTKSKLYRDLSIDQVLALKPTKTLQPASANKYLNLMAGFFEYAVNHGYCDKNTFNGLSVSIRDAENKVIFTPAELDQIFCGPVYLSKPKEAFQYWVPLIGLLTDMRLGEISQLEKSDIQIIDNIDVISVTDSDTKSLKTKNAVRIVPIHRELHRLGFLNFGRSCRTKKLFPALKAGRGNASHYSSKWFAAYLKNEIGYTGDATYHSFRHMVVTSMYQAEVNEIALKCVVGHSFKDVTKRTYFKGLKVEQLKEAVDAIDYGVTAGITEFHNLR